MALKKKFTKGNPRDSAFSDLAPIEKEQSLDEQVRVDLPRPSSSELTELLNPVSNVNLTTTDRKSLAMRGNSNAMKHGLFSKRSPAMTCDNCYLVRSVQDENYQVNPIDIKCAYYKENSACIYICEALASNVRDLDDVKVLMEDVVELDRIRLSFARAIEVYDGGGVLDQSLDMGVERLMRNTEMLKNFYMELNGNIAPAEENKTGILAQLLADNGVEEAESTIEED